MECLAFRRLTLEAPTLRDPAALRHRLSCQACANWAQRQAAFDKRLAAALEVEVPAHLKSKVMMQAQWRHRRRRWPAIAAGLVLVVGAGMFGWQWTIIGDLRAEVIAHVYHEPELLLESEIEVDPARLDQVLRRVGGSLDGDIGKVTHAGLCIVGGRMAAHLVVAGEHGPVAVLVMPRKGMAMTMTVGDAGLQGAIIPVGRGSIAVIGVQGESTGELAERILARFDWRTST